MTSTFDSQFSKIKNLKWLPWVGDSYKTLSLDNRLLIVGESHYHDNTPESIDQHNLPAFTRVVIKELAMKRCYYKTRIFPNLHRALFGSDEFDSAAFWNLVSFCNFIQRPMETTKGRPNGHDFKNAWSAFFEVVKVLKPKICLFLGTSSASTLWEEIQDTDFTTEGVVNEEYISNAWAKSATIKYKGQYETKVIFIRHTSQMFSWRKWHDYLQKKMGAELAWFDEQIIGSKS